MSEIQLIRRLKLIWNIMIPDKLKSNGIENYYFVCVFPCVWVPLLFQWCFLLCSTDGWSSEELNPALPKEIEENCKVIWWTCLLEKIYCGRWVLCLFCIGEEKFALLFLASLNAICYLNGSQQWHIKGKPVSFAKVFDTNHMEFLSYCTVV